MKFCSKAQVTGKPCKDGFSRLVICHVNMSPHCLRDCVKSCSDYKAIDDEYLSSVKQVKLVVNNELQKQVKEEFEKQISDQQLELLPIPPQPIPPETMTVEEYQKYQEELQHWEQRRKELIEQNEALSNSYRLPNLHGGFCKWSVIDDETKICGTCEYPYIRCVHPEVIALGIGQTSYMPRLCGDTKCNQFENKNNE